MKRNIYLSAAATVSAILFSACQITEVSEGMKTRSITVYPEETDTKTSVEYEYSDYSHLVWCEGDVVAYVTDCASDVVRVAEVSSDGVFTATIPESAGTDNRLYVVYPGDGLAGGTLADLSLEISSRQTQDSISTVNSTGVIIPMMACAQVPETGGTSVSVSYDVPVSVIRFDFATADFPQDQIQSVTFTAAQPVEVVTDNNEFVFRDGNFELDDPDATLYKVEMTLGEGQVIRDPYFVEISEGEQLSPDNKYLIAYRQSDYVYRVASEHISSKIDAVTFEYDPDLGGIPVVGDVMDYVFTIGPVADAEGYYWLYSEAAGNTNGNYIGSAGGTSVEGNFFFMDTEPASSDAYYIWRIEYGDSVVYLHNEGRDRWFKYSTNLNYFVTSSVGEDNTGNEQVKDVTILKLIE